VTRRNLLLLGAALSWVLLVTAAARPEWIGDPVDIAVSGRDLMMAVDLSGSMDTQDFVFNDKAIDRLTAAKIVAGDFIDRRKGDRIGLILFGEQAYVQTPLTFDRKTVKTLLYEAFINLAGRRTAIGDAIGLAIKRLQENEDKQRVLILMTDGASNAGEIEPLVAADLAAKADMTIYTIGIGADEILRRSFFGRVQRFNPSSDLDEETLKAIAEKTGGRYFRARNTEELEQIYALLDELEPLEKESRSFRPTRALFYWPLGLALFITFIVSFAKLGKFEK
jgi:Ca-activated chloride channel family protein